MTEVRFARSGDVDVAYRVVGDGAWRGRLAVHSNTSAGAEAFMRMAFDIDVRDVGPAINVPTLIVHATGDQVCHVENARFLARSIPGSKYVELDSEEHVPWFDQDETIAEIREFLTADAGEVLVSGTVKDIVAGSGLEFEDRGVAALKGIPGEWRLFGVVC